MHSEFRRGFVSNNSVHVYVGQSLLNQNSTSSADFRVHITKRSKRPSFASTLAFVSVGFLGALSVIMLMRSSKGFEYFEQGDVLLQRTSKLPSEAQISELYDPPTQPLGDMSYPPVTYQPPHPPPYWPPPVPKSTHFIYKAVDNTCVASAGSYCATTATLDHVVTPCPVNFYCLGIGPSQPVRCPLGSDTRGLQGQANCTCLPGYVGGYTVGTPGCLSCPLNYYCPDGFQMNACPGSSTSPQSSTSFQACSCPSGTDLVEGACVTSCVAAPGSYCAPQPSASSASSVLASAVCLAGNYCPGGRGGNMFVCPAGFGCPG